MSNEENPKTTNAHAGSPPAGLATKVVPPTSAEQQQQESAHQVVFADRTSQGYLLLVKGKEPPTTPTRKQLVNLVKASFIGKLDDEEVQLLIGLIQTEPHRTDYLPQTTGLSAAGPTPAEDDVITARERARRSDLLGLHIEVMGVGAGESALISDAAFDDPVLVRELTAEQKVSLRSRRWAILLRADYRNQHAVRGLRLLQTLVRIVAKDRKAMIFDPDTLETLNEQAFTARRLQTRLGNVADQIAIVPFPDTRNGGDRIRLSSRGMRRFGAVDIELDGLAREPHALQRATDFLYGLALVMIKNGEVDRSGFAVQVDAVIPVSFTDAQQAYGARSQSLTRCSHCPARSLVHLVERPAQPQDPADHVVARVVAPRSTSDKADYDHPAWVSRALAQTFGGESPGTSATEP